MRPATFFGSLVLILAGVAMYFLVRDAAFPILQPMGPIAGAQFKLIVITLLLASVVVLPVFFLLFLFAWKYRAASPEAPGHHHPTWDHDSTAAEFVWWLVPTAIIAVLAIIAWESSHALDPYKPIPSERTLEVQVVALDWKWLFLYPEQGIGAVNELIIPVDTAVRFTLTADAPMNSFWVPSLGGMIMVMPGMQTQLNLLADKTGTFDGFSGNLSGKGFSGMVFKVRSLPQDQFDAWVELVHSSSTPLSDDEYGALRKQSVNDPIEYFYPVQDDLFTSIHMRYMAPEQDTGHTHSDL